MNTQEPCAVDRRAVKQLQSHYRNYMTALSDAHSGTHSAEVALMLRNTALGDRRTAQLMCMIITGLSSVWWGCRER